ncbi:ubiquitin-protein transferase activating protein [Podila epigama]|nr:ubiquitin-protein transferase activating protein [Podila epigama]
MVLNTPETRTDVAPAMPRSHLESPRRSRLLATATTGGSGGDRARISLPGSAASSTILATSSNRLASSTSSSSATASSSPNLTKRFKPTYANLLQSLKEGVKTTNGATGASGGGLLGSGVKKNMFSASSRLASSAKSFSLSTSSSSSSASSSASLSSQKLVPSPSSKSTPAALSVFSSAALKESTKDNNNLNNSLNCNLNSNLNKTPKHSVDSPFQQAKMSDSPQPGGILGKRSSSMAGLFPATPTSTSSLRCNDMTPLSQGGPASLSASLMTNTRTPSTAAATAAATATASPSTASAKSPPRRSHPQIFSRSMSTNFSRTKTLAPTTNSVGLARTVSSGNLGTKLDIVSNDWKVSSGAGSTSPKKGKKCDRFIPTRTATTITDAHVMLDLAKNSGTNALGSNQSESTLAVAEACGLSLGSRILSFNAEAPSLDDRGATAARKMYSRHGSFNRSLSSTSMTNLLQKRTILSSPERVLDAPGMLDDYYLNLLDWSCMNVIAIGLDKSVFIWNAETGEAENLVTLTGVTDAITSVSWSYDGTHLAVGTFNGDTQIWDAESKTRVRSMGGRLARVGVLAWDKHILSAGCRDGSIWNHDVRIQNHKVAELSKHTNEVCGLAWRSDGEQLASGGNDNLVNIWDARNLAAPKFTKTNHTAAVKALAWCPWQNNLLASGGGTADKQIHFWNTTTGARVNSLFTGSQVTSIRWSKEYKEFMSSHGYPDNNISVYGYPSLNKIIDIPAHESRVLHTALSPDGQSVATVASDENLKFWKLFEPRSKNSKGGNGKMARTLSRSGSFSAGTSKGLGRDDYDDENTPGMGGPVGSTGRTIASMTRLR